MRFVSGDDSGTDLIVLGVVADQQGITQFIPFQHVQGTLVVWIV